MERVVAAPKMYKMLIHRKCKMRELRQRFSELAWSKSVP